MMIFGVAGVLAAVPVVSYYSWAIHLGRTCPPYHIAGSGWMWQHGFGAFWEQGFYLNVLWWNAASWLWGPAIILLAAFGMVFLLASAHRSRGDGHNSSFKSPLFFLVWLAGCALFYLLAALELRENPWNLHVFSPAVAALAACGLVSMVPGEREESRELFDLLKISGTALLIAALGAQTIADRKFLGDADYLLGRRLSDLSREGDLVVSSGIEAGTPVAIYYSRRRGWIYPGPEHTLAYGIYSDDGVTAIAEIKDLVGRGADWFGFVKAGWDKSRPRRFFTSHYQVLIRYLNEHATVAAETDKFIIYDLSRLRGER